MVMKFQYAGLSRTLIRGVKTETHSGRKRLRTSHVIAVVRESVEQSPKRSKTLPVSRSTMMRVMTEDLGMFPYRIQTHQKLSEADKNRRKEMAKVLLDKIEESDTFLKNLWTTDETHFHLDGQVNSKNNVYWVLRLLQKSLQWFQQDGAGPHTANVSIEWLKQHFKKRIVSRRCQIEWAPYSPDLNPPDFYLWGYLKNKVYEEKPRDLNQLKEKIKDEISVIEGPVLKAVKQNFTLKIKKMYRGERRAYGAHLINHHLSVN
ncbi:hypothetical protein LOD99_9652 [Oopsacas minuta]|uniref:Transposase n=1 Tax=Oopsacas minuta TaxID=111878 RepID=A0AAV7KKL9_9METZ|nr:hypothetical protein LOD99_9652 [Oopsacas minuta]